MPARSDSRRRMALATMIALFQAIGRQLELSDRAYVTWLPDNRVMRVRAAMERIAELPPAVACMAFEAGGMINICVWSGMERDSFADDILGLVRQDIEERWPEVPLNAVAVSVGTSSEARVRLPWPEFSQWMRENRLLFAEMSVGGQREAGGEYTLSALFRANRWGGTMNSADGRD